MPRFKFRFSALLKHRRQIEAERQRDLAKHLRTQMILRSQLRTMQQTISQSKQQVADGLVGTVDLDAIRRVGAYGSHAQLRGQTLVVKLADIERDIHQSRAALLDATRQRKALELLREKHHEQWKREEQQREMRVMDDMAAGRFARRLMKGWREMKSLGIAVLALLLIHLLAAGAGVGWLAATDRLSGERIQQAVNIFEPTIAAEAAAATEAEAQAEEAAAKQADALRLAEVADGPRTLEERLAESRRVDEVTAQRIERLKREREDIMRQIAAAKALIAKQRDEIAAREQAFEQKVAEFQKQREDDDFKQAVTMLEQLKAKQAKQVFQDMLAMGDKETVVSYLAAMNTRKAGAVLREFKTAGDIPQATELIEALRVRGVFPS